MKSTQIAQENSQGVIFVITCCQEVFGVTPSCWEHLLLQTCMPPPPPETQRKKEKTSSSPDVGICVLLSLAQEYVGLCCLLLLLSRQCPGLASSRACSCLHFAISEECHWRKGHTPPICIAVRLPSASQHFWENIDGSRHQNVPHHLASFEPCWLAFAALCGYEGHLGTHS